jgi:drug/metabolite transporter (DMT)-like permease
MKSIIFALVGVILYAIQNTIIDVKLKQYSTVSLLMGLYIILLPLAVGLFLYQKFTGQAVIIPSGSSFKILAAVAIMFFVTDFFYIGAYTSGGNVVVITILLVLMPVIGALIKFMWVKEIPTPYHFAGFIFAMIAVIFIAIGNSKKPVVITSNEQKPEIQVILTQDIR